MLKGVDLAVGKGEVVTVIGPSGSGKTTLLRCVNFLESYDGGSIAIDGQEVGFTRKAASAAANGRWPGCGPRPAWCSSPSTCSRT